MQITLKRVSAIMLKPKPRENAMELELHQELEPKDDLEIIDAGIETEDIIGPSSVCCWGALTPYRM